MTPVSEGWNFELPVPNQTVEVYSFCEDTKVFEVSTIVPDPLTSAPLSLTLVEKKPKAVFFLH